MSKITEWVKGVGSILGILLDVLPARWAAKIRESRKAIVAVAGSVAAVLSVVVALPMAAAAASYVTIALVIATGIATYWVPNAEKP